MAILGIGQRDNLRVIKYTYPSILRDKFGFLCALSVVLRNPMINRNGMKSHDLLIEFNQARTSPLRSVKGVGNKQRKMDLFQERFFPCHRSRSRIYRRRQENDGMCLNDLYSIGATQSFMTPPRSFPVFHSTGGGGKGEAP